MPGIDWNNFKKNSDTQQSQPEGQADKVNWGQFVKKKDDGLSGELASTSSQVASPTEFVSPSGEINNEAIERSLYDGYYADRGLRSPFVIKETYDQFVKDGDDEISAARRAGFVVKERPTPEGTEQYVEYPEDVKNMAKDAMDYAQNRKINVVGDAITQNITAIREELNTTPRQREYETELNDLRKDLGKNILLQRQLGLTDDSDPEELKQELADLESVLYGGIPNFSDYERMGEEYEAKVQSERTFQATGGSLISSNRFIPESQLLKASFDDDDTDVPFAEGDKYDRDLMSMSKQMTRETRGIIQKVETGWGDVPEQFARGFLERYSSIADSFEQLSKRDSGKKIQQRLKQLENGEIAVDDLSEAETTFLMASMNSGDIAANLGKEVPMSTEVSNALGGALGFMGEIMLTGGAMSGVRQAAKTVVLGNLAARGAAPIATKMLANATAAATRGTLQTALMPSTYGNIIEHYANGETIPMAALNGYGDVFGDVMASNIFTMAAPAKAVAGKSLNTWAQKFWSSTNTVFGQAKGFKGTLKAFLKENSEEQLVNIYRAARQSTDTPRGFFESLPSAREQEILAWTTGIFATGGRASNAIDQLRVKRNAKHLGEQIAPIKEDIEQVLAQRDLNMENVHSAIMDVVEDYGRTQGMINESGMTPELMDMMETTSKYTQQRLIEESWEPLAPDRDSPLLIDNEFIKRDGDIGTTMKSVANFEGTSLRRDLNTDKESVLFSQRHADTLDNFVSHQPVSVDDMASTRDALQKVHDNSNDAEVKKFAQTYIDSFNDVLNDMRPANEIINDVQNKPRVKMLPNEQPIEAKDAAESQTVGEVFVRGDSQGFVQIDTENGQTAYTVFDSNQNKIGQYNSDTDAMKAFQENVEMRRVRAKEARQKEKFTKPLSTVGEIGKVLRERAKRGDFADPQKALEAKEQVAQSIAAMAKKGKIQARQAGAMTKMLAKTDLTNPELRTQYEAYAQKIFEKAENVRDLDNAKTMRSRVKTKSKRKGVDNYAKKVAKDFASIDPTLVSDVNEYLEVAKKISQGLEKSKVTKDEDVKAQETLKAREVTDYIYSTLESQLEQKQQRKEQINQELTGRKDLGPDNVYDPETGALNKAAEDAEVQERVKEKVGLMMENSKATVESMIRNQQHPVTGDALAITENQAKTVREFMKINMSDVTAAEALKMYDALNNFIENQSIHGMEASVNYINGIKAGINLVKAGITAKTFNLVNPLSRAIDDFWGEKFATLPMFLENAFRGNSKFAQFARAVGLRDIINGNAAAVKTTENLTKAFIANFADSKVRGKDFTDIDSVSEMGMFAFMNRYSLHPNTDVQVEFEANKSVVQDTINKLRDGTPEQQTMADSYQRAYTKLLDGTETREQLNEKVDATAKEATAWWVDAFEGVQQDLADLASGVHGKYLEIEANYLPRAFRFMKPKDQLAKAESDLRVSSFDRRTNSMPLRESSVLMDVKKPKKLPLDKYVNLNFFENMMKSMEGALIDLNTSKQRIKLKGFMESEQFNQVFSDKETGEIFKTKVLSYVQDITGMGKPRGANNMGGKIISWAQQYAATRALGRVTMVPQQTIPVAMNTIFNAGRLDVAAMWNKDAMAFVDRTGYPIANRGVQSRGDMPSERDLYGLDLNNAEQVFKRLTDVSNKYLETFLVNPDKSIAKASWITYYKKGLKAEGLDPSNIDWATHNITTSKHRKAADYAQDMVDRQQNVSDAQLMGEFLKDPSNSAKGLRSVFFMFANFVMNQKTRMHTDAQVLVAPESSIKDKTRAARSLAGLLVEQGTFHALGGIFRFYMTSLMYAVLGKEETQDARDERVKKSIKKGMEYYVLDLVSPMPAFDAVTAKFLADTAMGIEGWADTDIPDEYVFSNYAWGDVWKEFGVVGIAASDGEDLMNMIDMADPMPRLMGIGKEGYDSEFMGQRYWKSLTPHEQDLMSYAAIMQSLYMSGLLPTDFKNAAREIKKAVNAQGVTKSQYQQRLKKQNNNIERMRQSIGGSSEPINQ